MELCTIESARVGNENYYKLTLMCELRNMMKAPSLKFEVRALSLAVSGQGIPFRKKKCTSGPYFAENKKLQARFHSTNKSFVKNCERGIFLQRMKVLSVDSHKH